MDLLAIFGGFAIPWLTGTALVCAVMRRQALDRRAGTFAWIAGAGWFVGAFLLTLWMRLLSRVHVDFSVTAVALPLGIMAALAGWSFWRCARRSDETIGRSTAQPSKALTLGPDLEHWKRWAW